jgi:hypothetical protein
MRSLVWWSAMVLGVVTVGVAVAGGGVDLGRWVEYGTVRCGPKRQVLPAPQGKTDSLGSVDIWNRGDEKIYVGGPAVEIGQGIFIEPGGHVTTSTPAGSKYCVAEKPQTPGGQTVLRYLAKSLPEGSK